MALLRSDVRPLLDRRERQRPPITDVRGGSGTEQKDTLAMTNIIQDTHYATAFETDPATVVAIDKQPFTG
jgi:hypothetical protein